jgi:hypothetical protein
MSLQDVFSRQIQAFHAAILDDCDRSSRPDRSDAMALRLRANALALAKVQLAMVALVKAAGAELATAELQRDEVPPGFQAGDQRSRPDDASLRWAETGPTDEAPMADVAAGFGEDDRVLAGDVLSRFTSRRLDPDESPHKVWQHLQSAEPGRQRRNPVLPSAGFRSSSG